MRVTIKLFAILRDLADTAELTLTLPPGTSAAAAVEAVAAQYPALAPHLPRAAVAINREYAAAAASLHDGDELALLPPVSGG